MSVIKVPTSFNIDVEFEIPEFYRRLIALLIDILVQYCYLRIAIEILHNPLAETQILRMRIPAIILKRSASSFFYHFLFIMLYSK